MTEEQRERAIEIAVVELRRVAGEELLMTGVVLDANPHDHQMVGQQPRGTSRAGRW